MSYPERAPVRRHALFVSLAILLATPCLGRASAQSRPPEREKLVEQTRRDSPRDTSLALVWWLPEELWEVVIQQPTPLPEDQLAAFLGILRPYTIVAAADGHIGPLGGGNFVDEQTLRRSIVLVDASGREYGPLPDEKISPDARNLPALLGVPLAAMHGELGKNIHFFFFPAKAVSGARIADAKAEGHFSVRIRDEEFAWDLPLDAFRSPKFCPKDGKELPGSWSYCPWHGLKLRENESAVPEVPRTE